MKRLLVLIPFLLLFNASFANQGYDSLLNKLNTVLDKKKQYDEEKLARIDNLKKLLNTDDINNAMDCLEIALKQYKN